jgi:hypothetical protein
LAPYNPRSLVNIKREISGKKWAEARQWVEGRITVRKYRMPDKPAPEQSGGRVLEAAGCPVPLAENRALSHRTIPSMDE